MRLADALWFINEKVGKSYEIGTSTGNPPVLTVNTVRDNGKAPPTTIGKNDGNFKARLEKAIDESSLAPKIKADMKAGIDTILTRTSAGARGLGAARDNTRVKEAMTYKDFGSSTQHVKNQ